MCLLFPKNNFYSDRAFYHILDYLLGTKSNEHRAEKLFFFIFVIATCHSHLETGNLEKRTGKSSINGQLIIKWNVTPLLGDFGGRVGS